MASTQEIYNRIFAGDTVKVRAPSKKAYDSLRTALCKKNTFSVALDMTDLSVCATYDRDTHVATFKLDKPARESNLDRWEVVDDERTSDDNE